MNFITSGTEEGLGDISVDYLISGESALNWSDSQVFDALKKRHQSLALQEVAYGGSLVGPHKHDIKFLFNGNDSRFYCSQGQQRALILALKIAQIVYHHQVHKTYPILLLDDVLSELDMKKRMRLMKFLEQVSAQILITSTDLAWSDRLGVETEKGHGAIFEVVSGQVSLK
jgi:DNA replication and repair protein RecF